MLLCGQGRVANLLIMDWEPNTRFEKVGTTFGVVRRTITAYQREYFILLLYSLTKSGLLIFEFFIFNLKKLIHINYP